MPKRSPRRRRHTPLSVARNIWNVGTSIHSGVQAANALKRALSRTQTHTRTSTTRHGTRQVPTLTGTKSNYKYSHAPSKTFKIRKAVSAPYQFSDASGFRVVGTTHGRQTFFNDMDFTRAQFQDMANTAWNTTAGETLPAGSTFANNNLKVLVEGISKRYTFSNAENVVVFVKLYDLSCIRDTDEDPSASWSRGLLQDVGTVTQGQPAGLSLSPTTVGNSPNSSDHFRKHWKIRNVTNVQLAPGQTHVHYVRGKPNYVFDTTILNAAGAGSHMAKLTHGLMIVAYGAPVHNAHTEPAEPTIVTSGLTALDFVHTKSYYFRVARFNIPLKMARYNLNTSSAPMFSTNMETGATDVLEDD